MMLEIGADTTTYGIVAETDSGLVTLGRTAEGLRALGNILRNMRQPGQTDHELMLALSRRSGRLWAREIKKTREEGEHHNGHVH